MVDLPPTYSNRDDKFVSDVQVSVGFAMSLGARVPQIVLNHKRGNTGELSLITSGLSCAGNAARLFTTVVLTSDLVLLWTTLFQFLLNGVLTAQCWQTEVHNRQRQRAATQS
jgi:hypothetical protein